MNKKLFVMLLALLAAMSSFSQSYKKEDIVPASLLKEIEGKDFIRRSHYKERNVKFELAPKTPLAEFATKQWTLSEEPAFVVESLYVIKKERLAANSRLKGRAGDDISINAASRICRSVSKMEGMKYYSYTSKKQKTLYEEMYMIKSPTDTTRVPDPVGFSNADGLTAYCLMNDSSFGKCNYRLEYKQNSREVFTSFTNVQWISYAFLKAVAPENLKISLVIIDCGDEFLIYMPLQAKFPALSIFEKHMNQSFTSRVEAICGWFIMQF